jgi:hypothetical protein
MSVPCVGGVEQSKKNQLLCCLSEDLATHRHTHLDSYFLDPKYVSCLSLWSILDFAN